MVKSIQRLQLLLFFCLLPLTCFSEQEFSLLDWEEKSCICKEQRKDITLVATVPIHVHCSYPVFSGKVILVQYANKHLKRVVEGQFDCFVMEEIFSDEEYEEECELSYVFSPCLPCEEFDQLLWSPI